MWESFFLCEKEKDFKISEPISLRALKLFSFYFFMSQFGKLHLPNNLIFLSKSSNVTSIFCSSSPFFLHLCIWKIPNIIYFCLPFLFFPRSIRLQVYWLYSSFQKPNFCYCSFFFCFLLYSFLDILISSLLLFLNSFYCSFFNFSCMLSSIIFSIS